MKLKAFIIAGLLTLSANTFAACKPGHMGGVWQAATVSSQGYGVASCTLVVAFKKRVLTSHSNFYNRTNGYPVDIQNRNLCVNLSECVMFVDFGANGALWESTITVSNDGSTGTGFYQTKGDDGLITLVKKYIEIIR